MKTITLKKAVDIVKDYNKNDQEPHDLLKSICELLKPHEGKKFTKRHLELLQDALKDQWQLWQSKPYDWSNEELCFRIKGESQYKYKFNLPVDKVIRIGEIDDYRRDIKDTLWGANCPHAYAAIERINKNNRIIESMGFKALININNKIANLIEKREQITVVYNLDNYDFPAKYAVDSAFNDEVE